MIYPATYALIEQDELTYVDGGSLADIGDDIKKAFDNFINYMSANGLTLLGNGVAIYGAIVDVIHIPAMINALTQGYTLQQIASYTFGINEDGTIDLGKLVTNSLNLAAGVYAMYRGGSAIVGLFKK